MSLQEGVRDRLLSALEAADVEAELVREGRWMATLAGHWKRTIPVLFHLDERSLRLRSFFSAAPDEGHQQVYRTLLQRNQRSGWLRFALDDDGNVLLLADVPLVALDDAAVDQLLGAVITLADETFNAVLREGFAGYIEAEQAWRAANDLPPNPVSSAP